MDADTRQEWERLCERFELRQELFDRTVKRHKFELEVLWHDLVSAGSAKDRFRNAHPEVDAP
jgi:hypothetical protein